MGLSHLSFFWKISFGDYRYHHHEKHDNFLKNYSIAALFCLISWNNKVWQGSRALQSGPLSQRTRQMQFPHPVYKDLKLSVLLNKWQEIPLPDLPLCPFRSMMILNYGIGIFVFIR
jgi:hypothetical protein